MAKSRSTDSGSAPFHRTLSSPGVFLIRMVVFLMLIGFAAVIVNHNPGGTGRLVSAIGQNQALNGFILLVLLIGCLFAFRQVIRLYREIRWVNAFRIADPGLAYEHQPSLLAPMAAMLRDRRGHISLSTMSMRSIMDSIGSRLDEARDTGRYLVGLLVFLGLLGTFWGLLDTIQSVGSALSALDTSGSSTVDVFANLKKSLQDPLRGMGTAFSSSLLGLAGSLVLGFLELQANAAQNRFYNELEEWLSGLTDLTPGGAEGKDVSDQLRYAVFEIQRSLADLTGHLSGSGESANGAGSGGDEAVRDLAKGVDQLVRQMRAEQKVVREWVDEQAAQQSEVASVLKDLAGNISKRS